MLWSNPHTLPLFNTEPVVLWFLRARLLSLDSDQCCNWLKLIWLCLSPGNDQLKKKVLEAGEGRDSRPQKGQNVKINLKTCLKDGTLVEEQPDISFTLGDGDVIQVTIWDTSQTRDYREISQSHIRICIICSTLLTAVIVMLYISLS